MSSPAQELSWQVQVALEEGQRRHDAAMAKAKRRVLLASYCNGREDCSSEVHLTCCLSVLHRE